MKQTLGLNPWLKIWTRPRETIRAIIQANPKYRLLLLYWTYGFFIVFQGAMRPVSGAPMPDVVLLIWSLVFAIVAGWIGINFGAALLYWAGKLISGKGSFQEVRAVQAWSSVPSMVSGALWLVLWCAFRMRAMPMTSESDYTMGMGLVTVAFLVQLVLGVWSFVILLKTLSEVQQFSCWKAFLNVLLPVIVVAVVLWGLMYFLGGMH